MSKISTAEEYLRKEMGLVGNRGELRIDQIVYIMNRWAKLHVEAALKAAAEKALIEENFFRERRVCKQSILTAYPLENIT